MKNLEPYVMPGLVIVMLGAVSIAAIPLFAPPPVECGCKCLSQPALERVEPSLDEREPLLLPFDEDFGRPARGVVR